MTKNKNFKINDFKVKKKIFFNTAFNIKNSIFIEACAGSGKTWLIIIRIVYLLIKYNTYENILIITFTNIACKEIKKKLQKFLKKISKINKKKLFLIFNKYGLSKDNFKKNYFKIKNLYNFFLFKNKKINFYTFHSWYFKILKSNFFLKKTFNKYILLENIETLIDKSYKKFKKKIKKKKYIKIKKYFLKSIKIFKKKNIKKIFEEFIKKRDEWLLYKEELKKKKNNPLKEIKKKISKNINFILNKNLWNNSKFIKIINNIILIFKKLTLSFKKKSLIIKNIINKKPTIKNFLRLYYIFYTKKKKKRKINFKILKKNKISTYNIKIICKILKILKKKNSKKNIFKLNKIIFNLIIFFLKIYKKIKKKKKKIDFIDIEYKIYNLLKNKNIKNILNINLKHILIDEFQDINIIQWKIINLIIKNNKNNIKIFFVGDPKQAIYYFRKSDYRIFLYAKKKIFFKKNFFFLQTNVTKRNSKNIINFINKILFKKKKLFKKQYTTNKFKGEVWKLPSNKNLNFKKKNNIKLYNNNIQIAQSILLAKKKILIYKKNILRKAKWKDFLILIRNRNFLLEYENILLKYKIPFISDKKIFFNKILEIKNLISLLKFLKNTNDTSSLLKIIKSPIFLISNKDLKKIYKIKKKNLWKKIFFLSKNNFFSKELNYNIFFLLKWIKYAKFFSIYNLLNVILKEGEIINRYKNNINYKFNINNITKNIKNFLKIIFIYEKKKNTSINKFIIYIKKIKYSLIKNKINFSINAVHITTIHKSKSLESPIVIIPNINDINVKKKNIKIIFNYPYNNKSKLDFFIFKNNLNFKLIKKNILNIDKKLEIQENFNILYVALTRAKQLLIIGNLKNQNYNLYKKNIFNNWYKILFNNNKKYKKILINSLIKQNKKKKKIFFIYKNIKNIKKKYFINNKKYNIFEENFFLKLISYILNKNKWPIKLPNALKIKKKFLCSYKTAKKNLKKINIFLKNPKLEKFFNPKKFIKALNEVKIYKKKKKIICNRIIFYKNKIWLLNYKLNILNKNYLLKYLIYLLEYKKIFFSIFKLKLIKAALILNNGKILKINDFLK